MSCQVLISAMEKKNTWKGAGSGNADARAIANRVARKGFPKKVIFEQRLEEVRG